MIHLSLLRRLTAALMLALMPLAAFGAAAPAHAQSGDASDAAYGDLYSAMQEAVDEDEMTDATLAAIARQFAATPEFARAEAQSPGLIAEVAEGLRPVFLAQSRRVLELYRPATLAMFARHVTPAEARTIAEFYRSPIGLKLMGGVSRNYSPDATLSQYSAESRVTREQVEADVGKAAGAAVSALTPEELAELGRMAEASPALLKMEQIASGVREIRVQIENEPLTAEENAAVAAVVGDVFNRRFAAQ